MNIEKGSYRKCFESKYFTAFTPYASRFHYEIAVFSKAHVNSITKMNDITLFDLAKIMKQILAKLKELDAPYNFFLHYNPDEKYHFHIEFCPRLAIWAGIEFSTGITINSVSPEEAAKFYRGEQ